MVDITRQDYHISRSARNKKNGHNSFVIWFIGLSGSGKSTIANKLEEKMFELGLSAYSLDGDNVRSGLNRGLTFSAEDRKENIRRIAEVAKLFMDAGLITITAFISPLKEYRKMAKEIIGKENFFEVFVNTPLEVCQERDVKGLYKKARSGDIEQFTGISAPFEAPENPDLEIDTTTVSVEDAVNRIYSSLLKKIGINE